MRFYWLVIGILGVWQVTHLLHAELGPWQILERFRRLVARLSLGGAITCFYCLSVWVALPLAMWLGESWSERVLLWPALAGGASLLERATAGRETVPAAYYEELPSSPGENPIPPLTKGNDDVQLRQQEPKDGGTSLR